MLSYSIYYTILSHTKLYYYTTLPYYTIVVYFSILSNTGAGSKPPFASQGPGPQAPHALTITILYYTILLLYYTNHNPILYYILSLYRTRPPQVPLSRRR